MPNHKKIPDRDTLEVLRRGSVDIGSVRLGAEVVSIKTSPTAGPFIDSVGGPMSSKDVALFLHSMIGAAKLKAEVTGFRPFTGTDSHRDIQNTLLEAHRKHFPPSRNFP